ncbi:cupin domain-containing protein [Desulfocurvibacter africanus PCS]|uniref:Cupin domain-containing protein n=1 Tax=Desulfocurvibacter africanus PCS TaxID=1262666 RepID=M5Q151_DESAF|nr:cupin domain-containing protein [Desulfocurvibacter africanus]EMG36248.1 cupin domain-containing protein [Desulfocurvibacter africanus PCS]
MTVSKVNLAEKFGQFHDHWNPRVVGELNGQLVKLARLQGEFVRHTHEVEDELFMVVEGELIMRLDEGDLQIGPGEFCIVPHGVAHQPVAPREVKVLLFEPAATLNTGDVRNERTKDSLERI